MKFLQTKGSYFEGWYLKHQMSDGIALALIPAIHTDSTGQRSASLQVITDDGAWWLEYPDRDIRISEETLQLGANKFSRQGVQLQIESPGLSLYGALRYGPFAALKSDIMGPFRFLPFMECIHGVISMGHSLEGSFSLNGTVMDFSGGTGYAETDKGHSFPSRYLWAQSSFQHGSLMLSVATIPMAGVKFTGCICAVLYGDREYRLATYRGARVERWSNTEAVICQGKYRLSIELLEGQGQTLRAPVQGLMERTIQECLRAKLHCRFWYGSHLIFDITDDYASFEYAEEG